MKCIEQHQEFQVLLRHQVNFYLTTMLQINVKISNQSIKLYLIQNILTLS